MRALVTAGRGAFRTEDRLPVCASVDPPDYSGSPIVRSFEPFEQQVRQLLEATIPYDQPVVAIMGRTTTVSRRRPARDPLAAQRPRGSRHSVRYSERWPRVGSSVFTA